MSISQKSVQNRKRKNNSGIIKRLAVILIAGNLAGSGLLFLLFGKNAKLSCSSNFSDAFTITRDEWFQFFYQKAYDFYERRNHIKNRATITISNIKEENSLEVLKVSDCYVKYQPSDDSSIANRWVEFHGSGVYTVDMSLSEFIIDDYNKYIIVRMQTPQLGPIALDKETKIHYIEEKWRDGNEEEGIDLALEDRKAAVREITKQLESNDENLARAKSSAESLIQSFVKNVNPTINLKNSDIQIEFF